MTKSKAAYLFATQTLAKESLFMWTFTFKDVLDIKDTRKKWNYLLTLLKRKWPNLCGLRVFELHKTHGLHVHLVTNRWLDVNEARNLAAKAGWGRIHVVRIAADRAAYLGKYLTKDRPECFRHWRLWAGFGGWEWTKVKDVVFESLFSQIYRACKEWQGWTGNAHFFDRLRLVQWIERRTIEEGWRDGFGPEGRAYGNCSKEELIGGKSAFGAPV